MKTKKQQKNLTLQRIINAADRAYPDGLVGLYHKNSLEDYGDTLAKFIDAELCSTYDGDACRNKQVQDALYAIGNAIKGLKGVADEIARLVK